MYENLTRLDLVGPALARVLGDPGWERLEASLVSGGKSNLTFELTSDAGERIRLSALRGKPVVLYFYPKADTPGCTTQACGVRDHRGDYEAAGAVVLGVSPDPVKRVKKFHDKQGLNFTLLADEDHAVCDSYGVWVEKSMYGRKYMGIERSAFLIDEKGKIANAWYKISPADTPKNLLAALSA